MSTDDQRDVVSGTTSVTCDPDSALKGQKHLDELRGAGGQEGGSLSQREVEVRPVGGRRSKCEESYREGAVVRAGADSGHVDEGLERVRCVWTQSLKLMLTFHAQCGCLAPTLDACLSWAPSIHCAALLASATVSDH